MQTHGPMKNQTHLVGQMVKLMGIHVYPWYLVVSYGIHVYPTACFWKRFHATSKSRKN